MMYVVFMKNFHLACSNKLMAVGLISAFWAQKRLIPTFWAWCASSSWKLFFSPIRARWHDVRRLHDMMCVVLVHDVLDMMCVVFMKIILLADSSQMTSCASSSWHDVRRSSAWRSRHDVRRLHENYSSRRFEPAIGCYTHFGLLSPKTFDSYFLDMMYIEFMQNFHLAWWNKLMAVRLISVFWTQKRLIPTF